MSFRTLSRLQDVENCTLILVLKLKLVITQNYINTLTAI